MFEIWQEGLAVCPHAFDDWWVEGQTQLMLVRFCNTADQEDIVVSRDNEHDFIGVMDGVGCDGQRMIDFGKV